MTGLDLVKMEIRDRKSFAGVRISRKPHLSVLVKVDCLRAARMRCVTDLRIHMHNNLRCQRSNINAAENKKPPGRVGRQVASPRLWLYAQVSLENVANMSKGPRYKSTTNDT